MRRTRIKICGITRPEDAALAVSAGADAVGLIFYPQARRAVTLDRAREILTVLPPFVTPVALFINQAPDLIQATLSDLPIRHVQLHGDEPPADVAALPQFHVLKALKADRRTFEPALGQWRDAIRSLKLTNLQGLVLETPTAAPGGTGIANDWTYLADCRKRGCFEGLPPLIAAGGLTPGSVADVIRALRPYAVDVSSGVESTFGQKDPTLVRAFIAAVHSAAAERD
jgi:phosphoribosylanthranilate isomerase